MMPKLNMSLMSIDELDEQWHVKHELDVHWMKAFLNEFQIVFIYREKHGIFNC